MSEKETESLTSEQVEVLQAFSRALEREAHVLSQYPDLLWQQLHNRLQWENGPTTTILEAEKAQRISQGAKSWVQTRNALPEVEDIEKSFSWTC